MQYTFFEVKADTYFKVAALPTGNEISFAVSLFSEENTTNYVIETNTIYRMLTPGNYSFFITAFSFGDDYCPEGMFIILTVMISE